MKEENYTQHMSFGLLLTLALIAGFSFYWFGENKRLEKAEQAHQNERVSRGREIYKAQCVTCHGEQGEGGVGRALNNKTMLKNTVDEVLFSVIRSGVPSTQMPAWSVDFGGPLTDEDARDVVAFIRNWEPTAPEIAPVVFEPSADRGAVLFSGTCAVCHGDNGTGSETAPAINDTARLSSLNDDWYRAVIRNGRPAKGMPTWGTVLSPEQIEDLIALVQAWRSGATVTASFDITEQLERAVFSLENDDALSALLQVQRALTVASGSANEILLNAEVQLEAEDTSGALATLKALQDQWPLGDSAAGEAIYAKSCKPCHGAQGEGGVGKALSPNEFVSSQKNAELVKFLLAGRSGTAMSGFKGRLTDAELADVVAFLRIWAPQK